MQHPELLLYFFGIALLYSSAGFGGGSSYLAILALYGLEMFQVRSTALLCNIMVVTGSVILFYRSGWLDFRRAAPLAIASVPAAFVGGWLPVEPRVFYLTLGTSLLFASLLMWFQPRLSAKAYEKSIESDAPKPRWLGPLIGGGIGFLSGMVGIGGGIFLAPVLYFIGWDIPKKIAAIAAFFILVNSMSGMFGQMTNPEFHIDWAFSLLLMVAVFIGGQIGVRTTIRQLSQRSVLRITAILIFVVSVRILVKLV
ncbi:MAG: sulfite exporter TauE/SafE family protein [Bacteroidetes bacterium]|nr:sulfite exporter TauE/SafE family protein [Bacteroidota bacterium]